MSFNNLAVDIVVALAVTEVYALITFAILQRLRPPGFLFLLVGLALLVASALLWNAIGPPKFVGAGILAVALGIGIALRRYEKTHRGSRKH